MRKLLIINGSPRNNGTDALIAKKVAECVKKYNYETEIINVCELKINGCKACMACKKTGSCAQKDDMTGMYAKIKEADMLILASPIYFGAESGQMKCFLDRFYAMVNNKDGVRTTDIGKVSKASIVLTCGNPNGNMYYSGVLTRLTNMIKSFNITDFSGMIISEASPETVDTSHFVKEYIESIEFQIEM